MKSQARNRPVGGLGKLLLQVTAETNGTLPSSRTRNLASFPFNSVTVVDDVVFVGTALSHSRNCYPVWKLRSSTRLLGLKGEPQAGGLRAQAGLSTSPPG